MIRYVLRRILHMIPTLFLISVVSFTIIQAPPGDMLTVKIAKLEEEGMLGSASSEEQLQELRERYHLDEPLPSQYLRWMGGILLHGDFGPSVAYETDVVELFRERLGLTFLLALATLIFTWLIAIPIGVYSATRPHSAGDFIFTTISFIGVATPSFFLALLVMYLQANAFGATSVGGLFSAEYIGAAWSWGRVADLLFHLWVPVLVIGLSDIGGIMRVMRGNLIDVVHQPHIQAARAKGLSERQVIWKYGLRLAINPLVSRLGMELPNLLSRAVVVSIVLGLPTMGPLFLTALTSQDMYLAGAFLLLSSTFLLFGNLLADVLLGWLDPRIRHG